MKVKSEKPERKFTQYLTNWKEQKNWKFNKNIQIFILTNIFNHEKINDSNYPLALEYVNSVKGGSRIKTRATAKLIIKNYKMQQSTETTQEEKGVISEINYKRAKKIKKMLKEIQ